jgi:hypothetical protein
LGVIFDTRQLETIDFFILSEQGIMRRTKQRIPEHTPDSPKRMMLMMRIHAVKTEGGTVCAEEKTGQSYGDQAALCQNP